MEDQWWQQKSEGTRWRGKDVFGNSAFLLPLRCYWKMKWKCSPRPGKRERQNSAVNTRTIHCAVENSFHEAYHSVFHEAYYFIYFCMLEQTLLSKCVMKQYLFFNWTSKVFATDCTCLRACVLTFSFPMEHQLWSWLQRLGVFKILHVLETKLFALLLFCCFQ